MCSVFNPACRDKVFPCHNWMEQDNLEAKSALGEMRFYFTMTLPVRRYAFKSSIVSM